MLNYTRHKGGHVMNEIAKKILSDLKRSWQNIPFFSVLLCKNYLEAYKACKRQWDAEELERVQTKRLRAILKHAYEHVEYYHRKFDSVGIKPEDIKTKEDLYKLPILSKHDIKTHFSELIATNWNLGKCAINKTSGSTGEPTAILFDRNRLVYTYSALIRQYLACGVGFYERILGLSHNKWCPPTLDYFTGFHRVWYLPEGKNLSYLSILKELRPTVIYGSPSYIQALAHDVQDEELQLPIKAIISSFELLDMGTRRYIRDVFGSDIFDYYSSAESDMAAWECSEHTGYHINADNIIVEILNNGEMVGEGERGEMVVTNLHNYAMPLIRYEIGDSVTFTEECCPCGIKLPLIKNIEGRIADFIVLPNGQLVSPEYLMSRMYHSAISKYQIIQESKNLVVIKIVEDTGFTSKIREGIENSYREVLGDDVEIKLVSVDTLPREKSGKFRTVISKVHSPLPSAVLSAIK